MDQFNFLKQLGGLKGQGDGYRKDMDISLRDFYLSTDGSSLTTTLTTNPGFVLTETNAPVIRWNAAIVTVPGFAFNVPGDYDEIADELRFRAIVQMGGATDTPVLTMNGFRKRAGAALTAALGAQVSRATSAGLSPLSTSQAPAANPTATSAIFVFDFSKLGFKANDVIYMTITPAAHGTDTLNLYGLMCRYRSAMALYTEADR